MESQGQIQDFLNVLRQRRWQILLPALFTLTLGIAFAAIVPKKFEVATRIELRESNLGADAATEREAPSAEYHVKHFNRVRQVIEEQASMWPEYFELPPQKRGDFVADVMDSISVFSLAKSKDRGSTFVDITYTDVNGKRAESFLRELTGLWVREVIDRQLTTVQNAIEVVRRNFDKASAEFGLKQQQYNTLARDLGIDPTQPVNAKFENRGDIVVRRVEAKTQEFEDESLDLKGMLAELEELQKQLSEEPPTLEKDTPDTRDLDRQITDGERAISTLEALQERYKPANRRHGAVQEELNRTRRELADLQRLRDEEAARKALEPNPDYLRLVGQISDMQSKIRGRQAKVEELASSMVELQREMLGRYPDYETLQRLQFEMQLAQQEVEGLRRERDAKEQELQLMQEAYGRPYDIVQEPQASETPSEPNPALIVAVGLFLGLGLGFGLAILGEFARNGFRSVHDLRNVMTVPVLGAVNAIVTRAEARRLRARRTLVGLSSAVVVGSILWVTVTWSLSPDQLPLGVVEAIENLRKMML